MTIRIATPEDIPSVEKLRKTAYRTATGSKMADYSFLNWSKTDDQSIVLVLETDAKKIISTMQGTVINTQIALEKFFDISLEHPIAFPTFTMGRAATFFKNRRLGYSAAMRILFLKACLDSKIQTVTSTIQEDASRVILLRQSGYNIREANINHRINSPFQNTSRTFFNFLPREKFLHAIATTNDKIVTPLSDFEIQRDLISTMKIKIGNVCSP